VDWLQLHLSAPAEQVPAVEDALHVAGAVAVSFGELGDREVIEPGVGEMPLWDEVAIAALFEIDASRADILAVLGAELGSSLPAEHRWEVLEDRPWEREWLQHFEPIRCGERLWVCPHGHEVDAAGAVILRLDPGLAFGTGTHQTTALCLEWLDGHADTGTQVIDYGCGSGILGIAALLLGAARVRAVDIDPQALIATRDNANRNAIASERLLVGEPGLLDAAQPADVLLANILAGPLVELAPRLAALTRPGGHAVLSGVLFEQAETVCAAYAPWFGAPEVAQRDEWCRIVMERRANAAAPALQ
jgi:ribosomal protein L11 methyltransferase